MHRDLLLARQVLEVCDLRVGKVRDRTNSGGRERVGLERRLGSEVARAWWPWCESQPPPPASHSRQ